MRPNELNPTPGSTHKKKRVGRGNASGHGTYATRGLKGQQSRSGYSRRFGFEGGQNPLARGLSRLRGFNNRFRVEYEAINVSDLAKLPAGSVTSESLRAAGIVKSASRPVKVLGQGELNVALNVEVEKISAGAKAKIEAAGGSATALIPGKEKKLRYGRQPASSAVEAPAAEEPSSEQPSTEQPETPARPARRSRAQRSSGNAPEGEDSGADNENQSAEA